MAERFEISERSAQRILTFLRDRMQAPIEYDRNKRGYFYTQAFDLPLARVSQEEILALLLASNLLSKSAQGFVFQCIQDVSRKLIAQTEALGLSQERIDQCFSAVWHGYSPAQSDTFQHVSSAVLEHMVLVFAYTSPADNLTTHRTVLPHHLQHYMGSWVLIAWCRHRGAWRKFYLSRMEDVQKLEDTFIPYPRSQWEFLIQEGFGIFQAKQTVPVVLRFTPFRARWLREQVWHPDQDMRELADGSLELTLPVADYREISMRIMSFGADVQVISPRDLRQRVAEEVHRMAGMYGLQG